MQRLSKLLALLLALALALVAAACGDDDGDDTAGTGTDETPTGTEGTEGTETEGGGEGEQAAAACEGVSGEVEVAAVWTGTEQDRFQMVLDAFTEAHGVETTYTATGDDIAAALGPRISGGDPPDVAILPQPALLETYAQDGTLQPVEDVAGQLVDENYAPLWRELATVDGELYGVWFKASNKSLVWYRPDIFEAAGVEPPETWDDFVALNQTIADFGVPPLSVGGADGWTLTDWFENVYLQTAGPEMYDQLVNHEIPWTDPSVVEALTTLSEVFTDDFVAGGLAGALQTDFNTSVTQVFAGEGEAAQVYEADFVAGVITGDTGATLDEDALVYPFPTVGGGEGGIVGGGDVAVLMTDTDAGRCLISYLATAEAGEVWAEQGGFISPNQNVDVDVYPDEISQTIARALAETENFRFDLSDLVPTEFGGTPGRGMFKLFQDFLANPGQAEQIAQQLEDAAVAAG